MIPNQAPELTVVLPAYEEAASLDMLLPQLASVLKQTTSAHEVIVVDAEHGTAGTEVVCGKHGVRYVKRQGGSQYGDAVRTAQGVARGKYIVFMDADGSHNPRFLSDLWHMREDSDLVIASRYVAGGKTENPAFLILMSLVVNIGFRIVLGLKCHDVSNSFRLYRGDDFRKLKLECAHFDIIEEMLVKLCLSRKDYRVKEVPFTFEKRKAGKTKRQLWVFALQYGRTLFHLFQLKRKALRELSHKS